MPKYACARIAIGGLVMAGVLAALPAVMVANPSVQRPSSHIIPQRYEPGG
jgi:hypothetical protein